MNLDNIVKNKRYSDLFILSRFFYRIGHDILKSDDVYNDLEAYIKSKNLLPEYINRTYDDDPIPVDLLKEIDALEYLNNMKYISKYAEGLDSDKTTSIKAVTTIKEVWDFWKSVKGNDILFSLKIDGVNGKTCYMHDKDTDCNHLEVSLSRARNDGDSIDYTRGASMILPSQIKDDSKQDIIIYGEYFVESAYLPTLKSKYDMNKYKTEKSSAISLLRVKHDDVDYEHLHLAAFNVDGVSNVKTLAQKFEKLKALGFSVAPNMLVKTEQFPTTYSEFEKFILAICNIFANRTKGIPSDGLVMEVNDLDFDAKVTHQYSSKNIALKLGPWKYKEYIGIVEDIVLEQQRVLASCRVKIKPLRTEDGCSAEWINCYNPSILIDEGITIGSTITFQRQNGTINSLVRS